MDSVGRNHLRAVDLRRHVDVIAEELVGLELHRAGHELPLVHGQGLLEQQAALVPVGAGAVGCRGEHHVLSAADEVNVEPAGKAVQQSCIKRLLRDGEKNDQVYRTYVEQRPSDLQQ